MRLIGLLGDSMAGSYTFEDTHILEDVHSKCVEALEDIIGVTAEGVKRSTETSLHLRKLGKHKRPVKLQLIPNVTHAIPLSFPSPFSDCPTPTVFLQLIRHCLFAIN